MNKKLLLGALIGAGISMLNKKVRQQPQRAPAPDIPQPDFSRVPPPQAGPNNTRLDDILARAGRSTGAAPGAAPGGQAGGDIFGSAVPAGAGGTALIEIARRIFQQLQQTQDVQQRGSASLPDILGQIFGRAGGKFGQQAPGGPAGDAGNWQAAPAKIFSFADSRTDAAGEEQADVLLLGMLAAAQADGRIDADEQRRIAEALQGQLDSAELEEFREFLTTPVDLDQLVARVNDPATAFDLYLVSAMTIDEENPREHQYLELLAEKLGISPDAALLIEHQLPHAA